MWEEFIYLFVSGHVYISAVLVARGWFLLILTAAGISFCSVQNAVPLSSPPLKLSGTLEVGVKGPTAEHPFLCLENSLFQHFCTALKGRTSHHKE